MLGSTLGRLECLLTVVTQEDFAFDVFLFMALPTCTQFTWALTFFCILKLIVALCTNVDPCHLPILVVVSHVPLKAGINVVRDATCLAGEGCLCRVDDDNLIFSCDCYCCFWSQLLTSPHVIFHQLTLLQVLQADNAGL